jgi:hypothetical protein
MCKTDAKGKGESLRRQRTRDPNVASSPRFAALWRVSSRILRNYTAFPGAFFPCLSVLDTCINFGLPSLSKVGLVSTSRAALEPNAGGLGTLG